MTNWKDYTETVSQTIKTTGKHPKISSYLLLILADNYLSFAVLLLTILFAYFGLFCLDKSKPEQMNWALHAAELSLGVFLGLLKIKK